MNHTRLAGALLAVFVMTCTARTSAHMFLQPYTLPVPFWLYLYGSAATLIVSFALVGYFSGQPAPAASYRAIDLLPQSRAAQTAWKWLLRFVRTGALLCLLVTMIAGVVGTDDPRANISMTLFWVAFLLGLTYATAILGDVYALANPWRTLVDLLELLGVNLSRSRVPYPARLGYLPALAFYAALIWLELFVLPRPDSLSIALLVYTGAMFAGAALFGKDVWFTHGDVFSVYFRLVGLMAPIEYGRAGGGGFSIRLRPPFVAACRQPVVHPTLALFVLFMLASTTYDAIHQTFFWASVYWQRLLPPLALFWGGDMVGAQVALTRWYRVYLHAGLFLLPLLYLLLYVVVLSAARLVTGTRVPLSVLIGQFALTLVPIALVYHATHYATIFTGELPRLIPLAADPFGVGWELFTVRQRPPSPFDMGFLWHSQVALMLAGHVIGVYLAHKTSVRLFQSARQGVVSQLPMLVLMVAYTCVGLWVLSLPLDVPQVVPIE